MSERWHSGPQASATHLCLCSVQLWFCRRASRPYQQLWKAGLKAAQTLVQDPGEKPEPKLTVFSGHGKAGRGGAGGGTKKSMAENGYTSTSILSCLLPRELANTASRAGLMLPREKARKSERRHSNRHGCGGSLSPSATPLAEGLAGHYKPPMPTPTSSPCLSPKAPRSLATGNPGAVQVELPRTITMLP